MKKIIATIAFVLFTTSAFSYSCPMLWGEVDELLKTAKDSGKTAAQIEEVKTFDKADEVNNNFENAKIEAVKVGNQRVMKLTLQPGWKWSKDIKPTVGGDSCQATHLGVIVSGAVCAKHNDGTELTYKAGDAYSIQPGHDGWVVGNEPAVVYEFHGMWGE